MSDGSGRSEGAGELVRRALDLFRAGDVEGSVHWLEQALRIDPTHADALESLGVIHDKAGRLDDAIATMELLRDSHPDVIMAWTNLSRFYVKKGWKEKAEEAQARARTLGLRDDLATPAEVSLGDLAAATPSPTSPSASVRSGPDPAVLERRIAQFEALLARNPDDPLARYTLARTLLQTDRVEQSIAMLEELLERKPDYSAAYLTMGEAYLRLGKLARAIRTFEKGIAVAEQRGDLHPRNQMQEALRRIGVT